MVWWCPSVRPSVRPSAHFLHFSHTWFDIMSWNFAHDFVLMYYRSSLSVVTLRQFLYARRDVLWYGDVRPSVRPSVRLSVRVSVRPFSALFSYMLWHIELKFCTWLCSNVLQIKFECRQFASSFVGVMPLLELRLLEIHIFPHFSLTCFEILSWNFAYDFVLLYYRSSSSVVNLRQFFVGVMPLLELKLLEIHSFPHFSLTCFDILSWNFAYDFVLLYYRSSSSVVNFCVSYAPFGTQNTENIQFSALFFWHALTYWAENLHMALFYWNKDQLRLSSICVNFLWELCPFWNFEYLKYAVYFSLTCFGILSWNFSCDFL